METVIGLYKTECIRPDPFHGGPLKILSDVEYATATWVECGNNADCTPGCTPGWDIGRRSRRRPPTTLISATSSRSRAPREDGIETVTLQHDS
jgi:hypothetical protein